MKNKIATFAIAAVVGLSAIAPASASMRLQSVEFGNSEVITVGSHSYGGGYKSKHYHKPKRHRHYHCHRRLVHGYWKKTCHRAWHNPHGRHHTHHYH